MLKWVLRAVLFRTVLRRVWWVPVVYTLLQRFLPWEKPGQSLSTQGTGATRRRSWLSI